MFKKIWEVLQISIFIFSSQVGSGLFILPSLLSISGYYSIFILGLVGVMALFATHVFATTGKSIGELIEESWGKKVNKIIIFIYWFISWFSTIVLFKELLGYMGYENQSGFYIELIIWGLITILNMWKLKYIMVLEGIFTLIKIIPLFFLGFAYFSKGGASGEIISLAPIKLDLFLRSMWCFIGLETGNVIGKNLQVDEKSKKIGTYLGMTGVIIFYLLSVYFCFSIVGNKSLIGTQAPYILVFQKSFNYIFSESLISSIVKFFIVFTLIGSINSWTISSGYITKECADSNVLPKFYGKTNQYGVPYTGVFLSSFLVFIFLYFCRTINIYSLIVYAINISCCFFLLIYALCLLSYSKNKKHTKNYLVKVIYTFLGFVFLLAFFSEVSSYCFFFLSCTKCIK